MRHATAHSPVPITVPRSRSHDGRFGRLFGQGFSVWQPPGATDAERDAAISDFAIEMFGDDEPADSATPVGYTYFGQFIDHDITFDPQSSLTKSNDPNGLKNFRSPRFDLDSLYGRGPDDQPYMYDKIRKLDDGFTGYLATGRGANPDHPEPDLPRTRDDIAIIGDPRNDENVIVSQLQLTFIKLHNAILDRLRATPSAAQKTGRQLFEEAQRYTVWAYQYMVWNDFVRRIVPEATFRRALDVVEVPGTGRSEVVYGLKDVYNWSVNPFMPIEFAAAAYRFGHSMIRAQYLLNIVFGLNDDTDRRPIFANADDPMPAVPPADLGGFKILGKNCTIQWDWFFDFPSSFAPRFPQLAHKIDTHMSRSVFTIPNGPIPNPLAMLNIRRGWRMELPPASEVATALGITPMTGLDPMEESLWVYILKEAETLEQGERLGPVGGTIVAAVFSGLLRGDPYSYIHRHPLWTPAHAVVDGESMFVRPNGTDPDADWTMADLIASAGMPIDADDIQAVIGSNAPVNA
ncbi:peroxidase family protein [Agromyces mangrovi Wang et al. 2018]|uniref:peroxidase family protein n=1 Tax=Agromyces mangrovi TaxID=1858653 RepID=UPI00257453A7|nr:heme peroxidase family protein [Agromyces mangrovi]BDZ65577.1 heme peroxidase [Agromyces mangrovi]